MVWGLLVLALALSLTLALTLTLVLTLVLALTLTLTLVLTLALTLTSCLVWGLLVRRLGVIRSGRITSPVLAREASPLGPF